VREEIETAVQYERRFEVQMLVNTESGQILDIAISANRIRVL
jgi:hypothetical protein